MMTVLKYLPLVLVAVAIAYIVGTFLATPIFAIVLSILMIGLSLFIIYLLATRVILPNVPNVLGAVLAILLLVTAPFWLISKSLVLTILQYVIIPLAILLILAEVLKEKIEEIPLVSFSVLLVVGIALIYLATAIPPTHPLTILLLVGFAIAGITSLVGAFLSLRR